MLLIGHQIVCLFLYMYECMVCAWQQNWGQLFERSAFILTEDTNRCTRASKNIKLYLMKICLPLFSIYSCGWKLAIAIGLFHQHCIPTWMCPTLTEARWACQQINLSCCILYLPVQFGLYSSIVFVCLHPVHPPAPVLSFISLMSVFPSLSSPRHKPR